MTPTELLELTQGDAEGALPPGYTRRHGMICYLPRPKSETDTASEPIPLCGSFQVISRIVDQHNEKPGTLIEFADRRGIMQRHTMLDALIYDDAKRLLVELTDKNLRVELGPQIGPLLKGLFADIANNTTCYRTAYKQAGWQDKGSFLLADGSVFGNKDATYALPVQGRNRQAGTLVAWQQIVADTAPGNSRLIFALSVALTGPVLDLADESFAGFHLVGASSTGKSTAATLAASVWGAPLPTDQVRSWRATDNALESVAAEHSIQILFNNTQDKKVQAYLIVEWDRDTLTATIAASGLVSIEKVRAERINGFTTIESKLKEYLSSLKTPEIYQVAVTFKPTAEFFKLKDRDARIATVGMSWATLSEAKERAKQMREADKLGGDTDLEVALRSCAQEMADEGGSVLRMKAKPIGGLTFETGVKMLPREEPKRSWKFW